MVEGGILSLNTIDVMIHWSGEQVETRESPLTCPMFPPLITKPTFSRATPTPSDIVVPMEPRLDWLGQKNQTTRRKQKVNEIQVSTGPNCLPYWLWSLVNDGQASIPTSATELIVT